MSYISRPQQCLLNLSDMRYLLIRMSIDENGNKIANRDIIKNPEFIKRSGLGKIVNGEIKPCSVGTLTKWLGSEKCKLSENIIYEEGKRLGFIKSNGVPFDEWSNKRSERKKTLCANENSTLSEIDIWSKVKDYVGLTAISLDAVSIDDLKSTLNLIGYSDNKIEELYHKFKKES